MVDLFMSDFRFAVVKLGWRGGYDARRLVDLATVAARFHEGKMSATMSSEAVSTSWSRMSKMQGRNAFRRAHVHAKTKFRVRFRREASIYHNPV